MKLTDLEPKLLRHYVAEADEHLGRRLPNGEMQWGGFPADFFEPVESVASAHGIRFNCPKCSPAVPHGIYIWFRGRGAPENNTDGSPFFTNDNGMRVRWELVGGTSLEDLQLSPSILVIGGCAWHGFIGTNGAAPGYVITC